MSLKDVKLINLPKFEDNRGNLSFIEENRHIPFEIKRLYCIYDVPGGQMRGGHSYKKLQEFVVALSGSFDVVLDDGKEKKTFQMNRSYIGLYIPEFTWRHLENFSTNSVCMILASELYDESDYVRDYNTFLSSIS